MSADERPDSNPRTPLKAIPVHNGAPGDPRTFEHLHGAEFAPLGLLRLVTERAVWLVRWGACYRIPREGLFREEDWSIEVRRSDRRWSGYRQAWWFYQGIWLRARFLPLAGPAKGAGIFTAPILAIAGSWVAVSPRRRAERANSEEDGND